MRPSLLHTVCALALCLAACAEPEPETPPEAAPPPAPPRIVVDSLVLAEPAFNYRVAVAYPQIADLDTPAARRVNAAIRDSVEAFAASIRPDPVEFTGDAEADHFLVGEAEGGPAATALSGRILSSRVDVYAYTGGAHGNLFSFPFTYDLATGAPVHLDDLFHGGTAWLDTLAMHVTDRLIAQRGTGWMFEDAIPPDESYFPIFTLEPDSLRLFFPPYAIAAYALGPSEVAVPYDALGHVLDERGPVSWLRGQAAAVRL